MDKLIVKFKIKSINKDKLEERGIFLYDFNEDTGECRPKSSEVNLAIPQAYDIKNKSIKKIKINAKCEFVRVESNPNRYFTESDNVYEVKEQAQIDEFILYVESVLLDLFGVTVSSKGKEYFGFHLNMDIKTKEEMFLYQKPLELLVDCAGDRGKSYYESLKSRRFITGIGFNLGEKVTSIAYDKMRERGETEKLKVCRFEARFENSSTIKLHFDTILASKLKLPTIKKKVRNLFEENIFWNVSTVLENHKEIMRKSLQCVMETNPNNYLEEWIGEIKEYIFDAIFIKEILLSVGLKEGSAHKKYLRGRKILKGWEKRDLEKIATSYFGNVKRLNELYKAIVGSKKNLI